MKTKLFAVCFLLAIVSFGIADETRFNLQTATNSLGNSVVVWQEQVGCGDDVFAQRYDSQENPVGEKLWVSENELKDNLLPLVSMNDSGSFVVAWDGVSIWGVDCDVYVRLYDPFGNPRDISRVSYTKEEAREASVKGITMTPSGKFVICWVDFKRVRMGLGSGPTEINVWIQQFASDGSPLNKPYCITNSPLDCGPLGTRDIVREVSATEQEITVVYRDNDGQSKTVVSFWTDIKPTVSISYRQESNPGDVVWLSLSPAIAGKKYQVYYCGTLENSCWLPLGESVIAEGGSLTVIDNGGATSSPLQETKSRFYKVCLVP